jgi:hypothetical protein
VPLEKIIASSPRGNHCTFHDKCFDFHSRPLIGKGSSIFNFFAIRFQENSFGKPNITADFKSLLLFNGTIILDCEFCCQIVAVHTGKTHLLTFCANVSRFDLHGSLNVNGNIVGSRLFSMAGISGTGASMRGYGQRYPCHH